MNDDLLALLENQESAQKDASKESVHVEVPGFDPVKHIASILEQVNGNAIPYERIPGNLSEWYIADGDVMDSLELTALNSVAKGLQLSCTGDSFIQWIQNCGSQLYENIKSTLDSPGKFPKRGPKVEMQDRLQSFIPNRPELLMAAESIANHLTEMGRLEYAHSVDDLNYLIVLQTLRVDHHEIDMLLKNPRISLEDAFQCTLLGNKDLGTYQPLHAVRKHQAVQSKRQEVFKKIKNQSAALEKLTVDLE